MTHTSRSFERGLWVCLGMLFGMILLGGLTRLTGSGLSIVVWKPLTGVMPPLNLADWQDLFAQYQASPQFKKINFDMDIEAFKGIFWLEFIHRLWGRALGFVFLWPIIACARSLVLRPLYLKGLLGILILGGLQGVMGWYMVKSGLVDRPEVSAYRLSAHFLLGVTSYGLVLWTLLEVLMQRRVLEPCALPRKLVWGTLGVLVLTLFYGALVAGLKAGLIYNTFPLMGGQWLPLELTQKTLTIRAFFEDPGLVQWVHRCLGITTVVCVSLLLGYATHLSRQGKIIVYATFGAALVQMTLGILTLLSQVWMPLAALHQGGALILMSGLVTLLVASAPKR
jgi:heme a synthase